MTAPIRQSLKLLYALIGIVFITIGVFIFRSWHGFNLDVIYSKSEWSVLQVAEEKNRNSKKEKLLFYSFEKYHAVQIRNTSGSGTWILLNPEFKPYIKLIGPDTIRCTEIEIKNIAKNFPDTHPDVLTFLQAHIKAN